MVGEGRQQSLERVVNRLDSLILLIARHQELGALEEDERCIEVASLKNRTVGRLRMTCFASDLGRLEPEISDLLSSGRRGPR